MVSIVAGKVSSTALVKTKNSLSMLLLEHFDTVHPVRVPIDFQERKHFLHMSTLPDKHDLISSLKKGDIVPHVSFLSDADQPMLVLPLLQLPKVDFCKYNSVQEFKTNLLFNLPLNTSSNVELIGWSNNALLLLQYLGYTVML